MKFTPVIYKILRTAIFALKPELAQGLSPCKEPACKVLRGFTKPVPRKGKLVAWVWRTIAAALFGCKPGTEFSHVRKTRETGGYLLTPTAKRTITYSGEWACI